MKVYVTFDFPEIMDANSIEADEIISGLEIDLDIFATEHGYDWYIDDAEGGKDG